MVKIKENTARIYMQIQIECESENLSNICATYVFEFVSRI